MDDSRAKSLGDEQRRRRGRSAPYAVRRARSRGRAPAASPRRRCLANGRPSSAPNSPNSPCPTEWCGRGTGTTPAKRASVKGRRDEGAMLGAPGRRPARHRGATSLRPDPGAGQLPISAIGPSPRCASCRRRWRARPAPVQPRRAADRPRCASRLGGHRGCRACARALLRLGSARARQAHRALRALSRSCQKAGFQRM